VRPAETRPPGGAAGNVAPPDLPILRTVGLTRRFGGHVAVDHVDLAVPRGALKSIIGPNGAGKTTLFNLLSGQLRPTAGRVVFDGRDVTALGPAARTRLGIGRSFQLTHVFPTLTVIENVRLAAQARARRGLVAWRDARAYPGLEDEARAILRTVRLDRRADAPAGTLPHGDKRKLDVGILLGLDPRLLLLDEPTAGMALEEVPTIVALIEQIRREGARTILLVEHKIDMVMALSDSIAVLQEGRLIADDTPERVSRNPAVQAAYFGGARRTG
jgi:branched-chain amino acid transport system ATP-binding protein